MGTIDMTMANPLISGTPTTIYQGETATLNIALTNNTGGDLAMKENSSLEIFMPIYFTPAELEAMKIVQISPSGWVFSYNSQDQSLMLNWDSDSGTWASGEKLSFSISNVLSSASPNTDSVQVNFLNLGGSNVPSQSSATLVLAVPPTPGNADLYKVLNVSPDYGGVVYVSTSVNPLTNVLYLNIKNIGATPLYNGANMWTGTPQVRVTFVYGTTSGSLAPDDKQGASELGSAWGISGTMYVDQTGGWTIRNPSVSGQANSPSWVMAPTSTNKEILGTGDAANVTFAFNNIVSLTPVGPTQMYVQFSGFMEDENTVYNDYLFVLGITKQNPPNPGAIGIYCLEDVIQVESATDPISIPLTWSMFGVGSVKLSFYVPGVTIPEQKFTYGTAHPTLNYDTRTVQITGITKSELLTVYCWAYADSNWQTLLNKPECTVPLNFPPRINSFTIETATIVPPASYAFRLNWDIEGESAFQITADSGNGSPVVLPIPQNVTTYVVNPTAPETKYTLAVYGNANDENQNEF